MLSLKHRIKRIFKYNKENVHTGVNGTRSSVKSLPPRTVYVNRPVPPGEFASHTKHYCSNAITTSSYTIFNFVPKNLYRQFQRAANLYFLILTIFQLVPYFALGPPFLTVLPIIIVLAITAIKDGFEDWRRHVQDKKFNQSPTKLVVNLKNTNIDPLARTVEQRRGSLWMGTKARVKQLLAASRGSSGQEQPPLSWADRALDESSPPLIEHMKWKDVRVGDIVYLEDGDSVPADMIILSTSGEESECYVETKNLDGETNLKPRKAIDSTSGLATPRECLDLECVVSSDPPSANMFSHNASITVFRAPAASREDSRRSSNETTVPQPPPPPFSSGKTGYEFQTGEELHSAGQATYTPPSTFGSPLSRLRNSDDLERQHHRTQSNATYVARPTSPGDTTATYPKLSPYPDYYDRNLGYTKESAEYGETSPLPSSSRYHPPFESAEGTISPVTINNMLLRGMILRNTEWAYGLVLYTGEQTKILLNSGPPPYKRSRLERIMNRQVLCCFLFLLVLCLVCSFIGGFMYFITDRFDRPYVVNTQSPFVYGFLLFWSMLIIYQNVVPISLYVSIEFVKSWQAFFIFEDINMYYEPTRQRCIPRNWNISDDMGQISYIFSDKTGTLTRNVMDFRMCSIFGKMYGRQLPGDELDVVKGRMATEEVEFNNPEPNAFEPHLHTTNAGAGEVESLFKQSTNAIQQLQFQQEYQPNLDDTDKSRAVQGAAVSGAARNAPAMPRYSMAIEDDDRLQERRQAMINEYITAINSIFTPKYIELGDPTTGKGGQYTFVDPDIWYDMMPQAGTEASGASSAESADIYKPSITSSPPHRATLSADEQSRRIHLFLTQLAVCHTVLIEKHEHKKAAIVEAEDDSESTRGKLTRIFRGGSNKVLESVRGSHSRVESVTSNGATNIRSGAGDSGSATPTTGGVSTPGLVGDQSNGVQAAAYPDYRASPYYPGDYSDSSADPWRDRGMRQAPSSSKGNKSPEFTNPESIPKYSAESPDESALVSAARNLGFAFLGRLKERIFVDILGEPFEFTLLETIPFNSTRKRMSTVIRRPAPWNDIVVFTKGADNVMMSLLRDLDSEDPGDKVEAEVREKTVHQIDEFANAGLRTLVLAYRLVPEEEFQSWAKRYNEAKSSLDEDREDWIEEVACEMERDLMLVGATAIEDKLQEHVPDAIAALRAAGIKIWVLTGDKMETAINIGFAANLLTKNMELWTIHGDEDPSAVVRRFNLVYKIMTESSLADMRRTTDQSTSLTEPKDSSQFTAPPPQQKLPQLQQTYSVPLSIEETRTLGTVSYRIKRAALILKSKLGVGSGRHRRAGSKASKKKPTARQLGKMQQRLPRIHRVRSVRHSAVPPDVEIDVEAERPVDEIQDSFYYLSQPEVRDNEQSSEFRRKTELEFDGGSADKRYSQEERDTSSEIRRARSKRDTLASLLSKRYGRQQQQQQHISQLNALVLDGRALSVLINDPDCTRKLQELAPLFRSVICCRSSPLQKAQVVKLIKSGLDAVTLAVGDGANDVSMIQAADIGVAIAGEEGLQAANASDYTIGRFHFLRNLLLVHGFFDYMRMSEMILTFFHKNVIWAIAPFWFQLFCRFSADIFYDYSYIQLYNIVFTVAPVVILGCVDRPFNYKTAMMYVGVYRQGINNVYFRFYRFLVYVLDGIWQSCVCFFVFYLALYKNFVVNDTGHVTGMYDMSSMVAITIVVCANLVVGLNTWAWNWMMWVAIGLSIIVCFAFTAIASQVTTYSLVSIGNVIFSNIIFWLGLILGVVLSILPRFVFKTYQKIFRPTDVDIVREIKVLHKPWYGQAYLEADHYHHHHQDQKASVSANPILSVEQVVPKNLSAA